MNYNYKTLSEDEIKKILETSETYYPKFNSIQTIESYYKTNYQYFKTTGGIVCILAGLILTPIIIGILIIFIGMGMKETTTYCSYCKMKI
ncbi:MAG: hypothetical protein IPM96_16485 [Ignavibacteria bacterium]|nr:hypothetical protein [Ignavibacteria bacterium]